MEIVVKQSERPHDGNQLHDEMVAAKLNPDPVMVYDDRTAFTLPDKDAGAARGVIALHAKKARPQPPERKALLAQAREAKTIAELRDVIVGMLS